MILDHAEWFLFAWVFGNQAGVPVPVVPALLGAGALAKSGRLGSVIAQKSAHLVRRFRLLAEMKTAWHPGQQVPRPNRQAQAWDAVQIGGAPLATITPSHRNGGAS